METYSSSSLCLDRKDLESKIEVVQLSLRLSSSSLLAGNVDSPSTWSNRKLLWDPDRFYCL